MADLIPGRASAEATRAFASAVENTHADHFRASKALGGLTLPSVGLGTYLGGVDDATDLEMSAAVLGCVGGGVNLVDCAINYRSERSERAVGGALREVVGQGLPREALILCTKGGFLTEGIPPERIEPAAVAAGCHLMTTAYVEWAVARSRANLGVDTIDLYYLHNPETQRERVDEAGFLAGLADAFTALEAAADDGHVATYGLATWEGLRVGPDHPSHIPLERVVEVARDVGGPDHRLRAVQLPLNLGMVQGVTDATQPVRGSSMPAVQAADALGLAVFTSASTAQGRLRDQLPEGFAADLPGAEGSPTRALLQWTRSCPGVTTALVGMTQHDHRSENLALLAQPALAPEVALRIVTGRIDPTGP